VRGSVSKLSWVSLGEQGFGNFAKWENSARPDRRDRLPALDQLAFARLLHDIVTYYTAAGGVERKQPH